MDINVFKKYTKNLRTYSASDVARFELMTDEELEEYQNEIERYDSGIFSDWDHIRAIITFKHKLNLINK